MKTAQKIRMAIAGATVAVAAVSGTAQAAGDASARVPEGAYNFSMTPFYGGPPTSRAVIVIKGNTATWHYGNQRTRQRFVHTPRGGYIDDGAGSRYVLNRTGRGVYQGPAYGFGIPVGHAVARLRR